MYKFIIMCLVSEILSLAFKKDRYYNLNIL